MKVFPYVRASYKVHLCVKAASYKVLLCVLGHHSRFLCLLGRHHIRSFYVLGHHISLLRVLVLRRMFLHEVRMFYGNVAGSSLKFIVCVGAS